MRSGGSMMQEDGRDSEVLKRKETEARDAMSICGGAPARRAARPRPKGRTVLIEIPTDRVDGISNTVHPWARIVRPMRLVRHSERRSVRLPRQAQSSRASVFLPAARVLPGETSTYVLFHWLGVPRACTLDSLNLFVHKTVNATRRTRSPSACAPAGHGRQSCRTSAAS